MNQKIIGPALLAGIAIGYVVAIKMIERRYRRLPWYKKALLGLVHLIPGR